MHAKSHAEGPTTSDEMATNGQATLSDFGTDEPIDAVPEDQARLSHFSPTAAQTIVDTAAWNPGGQITPHCDRCGTQVSHSFHRQWSDNNDVLDGCRHCLPRSVRFGEDVYGRSKDEAQDAFDLGAANKGRDAEDRRNTPRPNP